MHAGVLYSIEKCSFGTTRRCGCPNIHFWSGPLSLFLDLHAISLLFHVESGAGEPDRRLGHGLYSFYEVFGDSKVVGDTAASRDRV